MKTFLLIGHHKVGTTALQRQLATNIGAYRDAGVLYPVVDSLGLEHLLTSMSGQPGSDSDSELSINAREPHNALAFRILAEQKSAKVPAYHPKLPSSAQQTLTILAQQRALQPQATLYVSEVMSHFGFAIPDYLPKFKKQLLLGPNLHIIIALRRPDEHLQSWYSQSVRMGRKRLPPIREGGFETFKDTIHLQFRRVVEPWLQNFPEATFHAVYYPTVIERGGLVVFMNNLLREHGLNIPTSLDSTTLRNKSYHPLLLEPIRRWVKEHGKLSKEQESDAFARGENRSLPDRKQVEIWGKENRIRIFEEFEPQKVWFDQTFGTDALFNDFEKTLECLPLEDSALRAKLPVSEALGLIPGTDDFAKLG